MAPVEITGDGYVTGVKFIRTETKDGRVQEINGTLSSSKPATWLLKPPARPSRPNFLGLIPGLKLDGKGRIIANAHTGQTGNPQYFASGDAWNGGAEVVNASAEAKAHGARHPRLPEQVVSLRTKHRTSC